jgi:aspartyl-tRNA(Asn)/glutamyl-tRNA(Gln) amidotransferase subunit A
MTADIAYLSATTLRAGYAGGELSPVAVVSALCARIEDQDGLLNAVVSQDFDRAHHDAGHSATRWRQGRARPLEGVPVLIKDLIDTQDLRTTYGSGMFADNVPAHDAVVVAQLRRAGAIVLGKTATHEFGWGITTGNDRFGPTRNPWALDLVPGGSSGGSAAGLAAGYAPLALGTDTAGSIRIPAGFCGVAGLKPTFGAVSTAGVRALAPSLDHVGPMARTVADLRLLWSVLASQPTRAFRAALTELTVGICPDLDQMPLGEAAHRMRNDAVSVLRDAGVRVVVLRSPALPPIYPTLATTLLAEARRTHTDLGLWPARAGEYGADVRARLELSETVGLAEYMHAQHARTELRTALSRMLTEVDALLSPISAVGPIPIGQREPLSLAGATFREQVITSTAPQSLAGLPSLTVRVGFDGDIPVGIQLTASPWREQVLLTLGELMQARTAATQERWPTIPTSIGTPPKHPATC